MALEKSRIVEAGETPHAHERAAIEFAIKEIPSTDPYHLWSLCELVDPSTGRLYEIDLIVLGYSALYLIEVKSGSGRYTGNSVDWQRHPSDGSNARYMDPPIKLANHKAKVLKGRLEKKMRERVPWVEALVFLSAPDDELHVDLKDGGEIRVVTRKGFRDAVVHHRFPGADEHRKPQRIDVRVMRDLVQAMSAIGLQRSKGQAFAGQYELGEVLLEGSGFQDRAAKHRSLAGMRRRARVYLVPQQTSVERRQQLHRAAEREAQVLYGLREHPNILSFIDHETDAPLGPTVLFDEFEGGVPLPAFLRQEPNITLQERAEVVAQIGRAIAFCHRKGVVHRALSPDAVLVRRHPDDRRIDTRLFNFQLAESDRASATMHWSQLASDPWAPYQAPELREDPSGSQLTDIFSLGAVAYFVLTGREPGTTPREIDERLIRDNCLEPTAATDNLPERVADLVREATQRTPARRFDNVTDWVEILLAETTPEPEVAEEIDPLLAKAGDMIAGDLLVEKVLGHGATSRVLQVLRGQDNALYALKISLAEDHDERLRDEADALSSLGHPRIVRLIDRRTVGGRFCLVLSLAGKETLQSYLSREAPVSLDYAARFGDDLLNALDYLQEVGIIHRDIKPANLGVGALTKKEMHLSLFDFSLVRASPNDLQVGTSAYRDPFLTLRGSWDAAADRFSVAITLHEMVTGVRPTLARGASPLDPDAEIEISAERFDASCRDSLAAFFRRALARDVDKRFESAKQMRKAWEAALDASSTKPAAVAGVVPPPPPSETPSPISRAPKTKRSARQDDGWRDEELKTVVLTTPIHQLPLSARAQNALDRAGLACARDLLGLADNRLSAVRGVGKDVATEIVSFRTSWMKVANVEVTPTEPFFAGYRGDDLLITTLHVEGAGPTALHDAGLRTLGAIATSPRVLIEQLAERKGFDHRAIHALLKTENDLAGARSHPTTVEGWVDALLPGKKKKEQYVATLYGLSDPFLGRLDVSATEVAAHYRVTRANVYFALNDLRAAWTKHESIDELRALVTELLEEAGGAARLERLGAAILARMPHDRAEPEKVSVARAAALVHVVGEIEKEALDGLAFVRIFDRPWLVESEVHAEGLRQLAAACDALAKREVLASWGEVSRVLTDAAMGTPFGTLPADVLVRLGTDASPTAACSARQEIYPVGMPAVRALDLCASLLRGKLTPDMVVTRVAARYPDAAPLPARPDLDVLLQKHGLIFDGLFYQRPGEREALTSLQTSLSSLPKEVDERAADFEERLRKAAQGGGLCVVGVRVGHAERATMALAKRLGVDPIDMSKALVDRMQRIEQRDEVDPEVVHGADVGGESDPEGWANLRSLANDAAIELADAILPPKKALLLAQPGLFARYRLDCFNERLRQAASANDAPAIFIVVPSRDVRRVPHLDGWVVAGATSMWMPDSWVEAASRGL